MHADLVRLPFNVVLGRPHEAKVGAKMGVSCEGVKAALPFDRDGLLARPDMNEILLNGLPDQTRLIYLGRG
jgi:hypothetical protein